MQCTCGWKKPLVCVVSPETVSEFYVVMLCPECGLPSDAMERTFEPGDVGRIQTIREFIHRKKADA